MSDFDLHSQGEEGEPGRPGEPGEDGGGAGGTGGRGGRGGRGATVQRGWRRHRALVGYLFIVLVVVAALQVHHSRTTRELRDSDRRTCLALAKVTDNQRFVLQTLVVVIARHTAVEPSPDLVSRLDILDRRMNGLPEYDCREGFSTP